jgi:light-regulated signal transduction histidine kinase (bacteriophytochrome)
MLAAGSHYFPDVREMPEHVPLVERMIASGLCSLILVPLRFDGKLIGEVTVSSTRAAAFQSVHQQIAREVADQLAISLQQARLREELECYTVELEQRVAERTTQLEAAVVELQKEVDARTLAEEAVQKLNRDLKQRARELNEANIELEAFAYSVSHDLRAPLRAIDGFSRIVLADHASGLPEEAQRYLQLVRDNTHQMGKLIDDLLSFSRLNRQPLNKITVEPNAIVRLVLKDLAQVQNMERVNIVVNSLPPCQADPGLLRQVYANLLSNAFKFTGKQETPCIEVGCHEQDGERVYYVKDNGVGFDMQFAAKIFGVFQRLHRAEDYEGTGVGLAIVQRIINRHGGRIWAEAEPEKGAAFNFTLGEPA